MFSEETGAVIQLRAEFEDQALEFLAQSNILHRKCAAQNTESQISIVNKDEVKFQESVISLEKTWSETSLACLLYTSPSPRD